MSNKEVLHASSIVTRKGFKKKRRLGTGRPKVFIRQYKLRAQLDSLAAFDEWIAEETKRSPWYLCSSYRGGGLDKKIYACSYRKRAGFQKCSRQLMVECHEDGSVRVLDSNIDEPHIHKTIEATDENSYSKPSKRAKLLGYGNEQDEQQNSVLGDSRGKRRRLLSSETGESSKAGTKTKVEDFVIISGEEFYAADSLEGLKEGSTLAIRSESDTVVVDDSTIEKGRVTNEDIYSAKASATTRIKAVGSSVGVHYSDRHADTLHEKFVVCKEESESGDAVDSGNYDLNLFAAELAKKLAATPIENLASVRAKLRREMDEVFAKQVVNEIADRAYSPANRREVIDRIRGVFDKPV